MFASLPEIMFPDFRLGALSPAKEQIECDSKFQLGRRLIIDLFNLTQRTRRAVLVGGVLSCPVTQHKVNDIDIVLEGIGTDENIKEIIRELANHFNNNEELQQFGEDEHYTYRLRIADMDVDITIIDTSAFETRFSDPPTDIGCRRADELVHYGYRQRGVAVLMYGPPTIHEAILNDLHQRKPLRYIYPAATGAIVNEEESKAAQVEYLLGIYRVHPERIARDLSAALYHQIELDPNIREALQQFAKTSLNLLVRLDPGKKVACLRKLFLRGNARAMLRLLKELGLLEGFLSGNIAQLAGNIQYQPLWNEFETVLQKMDDLFQRGRILSIDKFLANLLALSDILTTTSLNVDPNNSIANLLVNPTAAPEKQVQKQMRVAGYRTEYRSHYQQAVSGIVPAPILQDAASLNLQPVLSSPPASPVLLATPPSSPNIASITSELTSVPQITQESPPQESKHTHKSPKERRDLKKAKQSRKKAAAWAAKEAEAAEKKRQEEQAARELAKMEPADPPTQSPFAHKRPKGQRKLSRQPPRPQAIQVLNLQHIVTSNQLANDRISNPERSRLRPFKAIDLAIEQFRNNIEQLKNHLILHPDDLTVKKLLHTTCYYAFKAATKLSCQSDNLSPGTPPAYLDRLRTCLREMAILVPLVDRDDAQYAEQKDQQIQAEQEFTTIDYIYQADEALKLNAPTKALRYAMMALGAAANREITSIDELADVLHAPGSATNPGMLAACFRSILAYYNVSHYDYANKCLQPDIDQLKKQKAVRCFCEKLRKIRELTNELKENLHRQTSITLGYLFLPQSSIDNLERALEGTKRLVENGSDLPTTNILPGGDPLSTPPVLSPPPISTAQQQNPAAVMVVGAAEEQQRIQQIINNIDGFSIASADLSAIEEFLLLADRGRPPAEKVFYATRALRIAANPIGNRDPGDSISNVCNDEEARAAIHLIMAERKQRVINPTFLRAVYSFITARCVTAKLAMSRNFMRETYQTYQMLSELVGMLKECLDQPNATISSLENPQLMVDVLELTLAIGLFSCMRGANDRELIEKINGINKLFDILVTEDANDLLKGEITKLTRFFRIQAGEVMPDNEQQLRVMAEVNRARRVIRMPINPLGCAALFAGRASPSSPLPSISGPVSLYGLGENCSSP